MLWASLAVLQVILPGKLLSQIAWNNSVQLPPLHYDMAIKKLWIQQSSISHHARTVLRNMAPLCLAGQCTWTGQPTIINQLIINYLLTFCSLPPPPFFFYTLSVQENITGLSQTASLTSLIVLLHLDSKIFFIGVINASDSLEQEQWCWRLNQHAINGCRGRNGQKVTGMLDRSSPGGQLFSYQRRLYVIVSTSSISFFIHFPIYPRLSCFAFSL